MLIAAALVALTLPSPVPTAAAERAIETRWVLAPTGNEARYRVREQLAGVDFPNDAVGVTSALTGELVFDDAGKVVVGRSKITVDLRTLKSDRERRDGYIQRRTLETETYPNAELAITAIEGLPSPLPTSGEHRFTLTGSLLLKGTARPTTWQVTATATPDGWRGTATTQFTFEQFGLTKPRVASVLSVDDVIKLEYVFHFVKS